MKTRKIKQFDYIPGEIKLSVGCENRNEVLTTDVPQPDLKTFIGMDNRDLGQEIVWDLMDGIPLPDNSVAFIWASHVLEHFDPSETQWVINEMWRVLKPGGTLEIRVPHISSSTAYLPQHKQQINEHYFSFFTSPNVVNYGLGRWEMELNEVYHRKGTKYDLRVIMHPDKKL